MTDLQVDREHGIVEITVDDEYIDQEAFEEMIDKFRSLIDEHGRIKVIEVVKQFPDFDPGLLLDDLAFSYQNMNNITHCAVVSDEGWVGPYARMLGVLVPCDIRVFKSNEIENAREWIREAGSNRS